MKIKTKYIRGFTLLEMLISMIITSMATIMMMFVFNESKRNFLMIIWNLILQFIVIDLFKQFQN